MCKELILLLQVNFKKVILFCLALLYHAEEYAAF